MDPALLRRLEDKSHEKRKLHALELERIVRDATVAGDFDRIDQILDQLEALHISAAAQPATRSGASIGFAATAIGLGSHVGRFLPSIVPPILSGAHDVDTRMRYYTCESLYNVVKSSRGEILVYFNELFDGCSRLAADTDPAVKSGADLLDRLIKDVVTDEAATYVSLTNRLPSRPSSPTQTAEPERAFSLARFVPLLAERITTHNPFTRNYLVSWLVVLDSVPELELVSFLPEFLHGLFTFLGDPTADIRTATQTILSNLLKEIIQIANADKPEPERSRRLREETYETGDIDDDSRTFSTRSRETTGGGFSIAERNSFTMGELAEVPETDLNVDEDLTAKLDDVRLQSPTAEDPPPLADEELALASADEDDAEGSGEWIPGQGVFVDYEEIVRILIRSLAEFEDEEVQSISLRWISAFVQHVPEVVVAFVPQLISVILPALAHDIEQIKTAANDTNYAVWRLCQSLPDPEPSDLPNSPPLGPPQVQPPAKQDRTTPASSPPATSIPFPTSAPRGTAAERKESGNVSALSSKFENLKTDNNYELSEPTNGDSLSVHEPPQDLFNYSETVHAVTVQLVSDHEQTRCAALQWLLMLHEKAPEKCITLDEIALEGGSDQRNPSRSRRAHEPGQEPGLAIAMLLKLLSDESEQVLRFDLLLLAQISREAGADHFPGFMKSLLSLFATDRRLLETRGSLIIRQLCFHLNTEQIFRTFAEILEKDDDLEFASIMVQNLNLILITSPELTEFRRRLRSIETQDGKALFSILYRSWSHNAVATFSLCLLAGAYEQACHLLQIMADLEISVGMLVQIDKLVQLLESPVFTSLRLQLLEPERYPFLLKAMYGLLMLLPQSSAFGQLRNRLSAVSALGFPGAIAARSSASNAGPSGSSTVRGVASGGGGAGAGASGSALSVRRGEDSIRWNELLHHFKAVQKRRSSASQQSHSLGGGANSIVDSPPPPSSNANGGAFGHGAFGMSAGRAGSSGTFGGVGNGLGISGMSNAGGRRRVTPAQSGSLASGGTVRGGSVSGSTLSRQSSMHQTHTTSSGASLNGRATSPVVAKKRIASAPARKI